MKISRIELFLVSIPLTRHHGFFAERQSFHPNWIPGFHQQDVKFYLLRLSTDDGLDGVAAIPAMGQERAGLGQLLGSYLLGMNPLDTRLVNQRIEEFSYIGMRNGWIDAAFWDLIGKEKNQPLWKVLGGSGGYATPYASLGSNHEHDPKKVAELVRQRKDFAGVKVRVKSMDLSRMVEVVAAAREALGPDKQLMVDANLGWPVEILQPTPRWDVDFATRFARAIEPYNVAWLEEPIHRADFTGMARLRAASKTKIAGGEINSSWLDFKAMLDAGSLDVYQPDAVLAGGTFAGGISVVYWLIREIEKRNHRGDKPVRYTPHTWTTGLGFAVNLQLFGVVADKDRGLLELPHDELWEPPQWASFIRGQFQRESDGRIKVPDAPGLGVEIDWKAIKRHGKRLFLGTKRTMTVPVLSEHGYREAMYLREKKTKLALDGEKTEFVLPPSPF